jgi:hypothetical protein
MKKKIVFLTAGLLVSLLSVNGFAQQKLAQTGFQFLSVNSDARAAAMGEAMTSLQLGSNSLFFNPAGMAEMNTIVGVAGSTNKWIADITHTTYSLAVNPSDGRYGVIGFSAQYVNYGDFYGTVVDQASPQGYDDIGIFKLSSYALGIGYAKQLTEQFSLGGQVKWVHQDLGTSIIPMISGNDTSTQTTSNKLSPLAFDFGTQFKTGIKSLVFGMSVRNFSQEIKYAQEEFETPLVFNLGISMNVLDFAKTLPFDQSLLVSVDASHYTDAPEQVKVGLEYCVAGMVSLRAGYISSSAANDEGSGLSYGLGLSKFGFAIDYAYTPFGDFGNVQRFTARFVF